MERLSSTIFLLLWATNFARGMPHTDVTYEDLEKLDAVCHHQDSCKIRRISDTLLKYTCHCESFCAELDTCCIDSPYRDMAATGPAQTCTPEYGIGSSNYFMVDRCPLHGRNTDDVWRKLCESGDTDDLMSSVPVTSLSTNLTYKNYFCLRCHETPKAAYRYWNVQLFSSQKINEVPESALVTYNAVNRTWMAPIGTGGTPIPVSLGLEIPTDVMDLPKLCALNVISSCSAKWRDASVSHKCNAYASIIYIRNNGQFLSYRNPHCAVCNFEDLGKMLCSLNSVVRTSKKPFSFSHLLDINRSDGDKVGKITNQCDGDSIWDPFFKKCRILKCALPGHVVQENKCTPS